MGKENGEGGGQFTSKKGPEWKGVAPHAKEGFQVSKRDSGRGERFSRQRGNYHGGIVKGLSRGLRYVPNTMSTLYISCYCVYVVLIQELCLGYK